MVLYKICGHSSYTTKFRKIQTELWWGNNFPHQLKKESELTGNLTGLDLIFKVFPAQLYLFCLFLNLSCLSLLLPA